MKIEIIRQRVNKKQLKKNIFLGFLCLLMISGFLFFVLNPVLTKAQDLNNGLTNFQNASGYSNTELPTAMGRIMKIVLGILGLAATVIIIAGGIKWMTSGGDEKKISEAKKLMIAGIIGILIIVLAYAIGSYIINRIMEVTGPSTYCVGSNCCTPDSCCDNSIGMKFDANCKCTIPAESTCRYSPDYTSLLMKSGEASFDTDNITSNPDAKVYRCSKIKPFFNYSLNSNEVSAVITDQTLKVVKNTDTTKQAIQGVWKISGNSVLFTPQTIWDPDTKYNVIIPKSIKDTYNPSRSLSGCSTGFKPKYHCSDGDTVVWDFTTNNVVDTEAPYLNKTYPTNDAAKPNQWVSRAPIIDLNFSESVDFDTIADKDGHPIPTSFKIEKLASRDAESGTAVGEEILIVKDKFQGFSISLINPNLLDSFTWYKITVANVKDLCGNSMAAPQSWKFETNDVVPGISDYWPKDKNVCPDEPIGVSFATSMYNNTIAIQGKIGKNIVFQSSIKPIKELEAAVMARDGNTPIGKMKVIDADVDNISTQFKVFEIELNNNLTAGASYSIDVTTDLVMDVDQNKLGKKWDFTTTDLTKCACSPVIYRVTPDSGSRKSCVTVFGRCFQGTASRKATITTFQFDDKYPVVSPAQPRINGEDGPINATVESSGPDFITTTIPAVFGDPVTDISDSLGVRVGITYDDTSKSETVSWDKFLVNDNSESTGPCLLSINPSSGYPKGDPSETKVSFNGLRFGAKNIDSKIIFYNQSAAAFSEANWSDTQVRDVLVPVDTQTGDVVIKNSNGTSNGLPFKVLFRTPKPGDKCQDVSCPNNFGSCSVPYQCKSGADTCRCCCNPKQQNSCGTAGLTCLANQGNCKGPDDNPRGLCCGCKNDAQCGAGVGCGILDPNKCCHPQPIIINASKSPAGGEINVCKNTSISMTFDNLMDHDSLNENNIKLLSSDVNPGYETDIEEGMVALWHFNEVTGSTTKDAKGTNDGTLSGPIWVEGKFKNALEFDGARGDNGGDYITISDNSSLDLQKLSLDVWIKISKGASVDKNRMVILAKGDEGITAKNNYVLDLYRNGPNTGQWQPGFIVGTGTHPNLTNVRGSTWLSEDVFYRITATYDGENLKIYVNGKLDGIQPKTFGTKDLVNAGNLVIGRQSEADSNGDYYSNFRGVIDEVRIYNQALNDEKISAPHQVKGKIVSADDNIKEETTVHFYPFNCLLNQNSTHQIWVKGGVNGSGVRSKMGVSISDTDWTFKTGNGMCHIATIKVDPMNPAALNESSQTTKFAASALDSDSRSVCVDKFDWSSQDPGIANVSPSSGLSTVATPLGKYGQTLIKAAVEDISCLTTNTCALLKFSPKELLQVKERTDCDNCNLGGQSPSPAHQSTDACIQAQIRVKFNREVVMDTTSATDNIIIQKCGTGDFNNSQCPSDNSNKIKGDFTIEKDGFYFKPKAVLEKDKIYRVTLKSGPNGIKDKFGLELDKNKNGVQDGTPNDDYTWMFIATNDNCSLKKICLNPAGINQITHPATQPYHTEIYTANCNYLNPEDYNGQYFWASSDKTVATIGASTDYNNIATSKKLGETDITVSTTTAGDQPVSSSSHLIVATQPIVNNTKPTDKAIDVCRNTVISATFDQLMDRTTLNPDTIKLYKYCPATASLEKNNIFVRFFNNLKNIFLKKVEAGNPDIYDLKADISAVDNNTTKQTTVYINSGLLDASGVCTYQVEISGKEGIAGKENVVKSKYGIEMADNNSWTFNTGADICKLSKVEITAEEVSDTVNPVNKDPGKPIISSTSVEFYKKDSTVKFSAKALDNKGAEIHGVSDYDWTWSWDSSKPNVVLVPISNNSSQTATAQNQNGDSKIKVTAKITDTSKSDIGKSFSATAQAKVFLCEFPWKFEDSATNFKLQYCRGNLGKNLVFNGAMSDGVNGWSANQQVGISTVKKSNYNILKATNNQSGSTPGVISANWITVSPNTQYTVSMAAYRTGSAQAYIYVQGKNASSYTNLVWYGAAIPVDTLAKISNTFTTGANDTAIKVGILWSGSVKNDVIYMTNVQLEKGKSATEYQNLPSLPNLILTKETLGTTGNLVKQFFFTLDNDKIGLQVFKNQDYLIPSEWYNMAPNPNGSLSNITVDGYKAVQDEQTVYVGATNTDNNKDNIKGLIYLISHTNNYTPETINIYNQLVKYWQFNANKDAQGNYLISQDDKAEIQRDLVRIQDIRTMSQKLTDYKSTNSYYPKLESGSYIIGMTTSRWIGTPTSSWDNTQSNFIDGLPNDPINQFVGNCAESDAGQWDRTCYNKIKSIYECPANSQVYQYMVTDSGEDYRLYLNFEMSPSKWQAGCSDYKIKKDCEIHYLCGWATNECQQKLFGYSSSSNTYKCFNSVYGPVIENTNKDIGTQAIKKGGDIS